MNILPAATRTKSTRVSDAHHIVRSSHDFAILKQGISHRLLGSYKITKFVDTTRRARCPKFKSGKSRPPGCSTREPCGPGMRTSSAAHRRFCDPSKVPEILIMVIVTLILIGTLT